MGSVSRIPNVTGRCNTAIAEKAVYACPRYRSVYGKVSVTLTRWNHSVLFLRKRLIWALRTLI